MYRILYPMTENAHFSLSTLDASFFSSLRVQESLIQTEHILAYKTSLKKCPRISIIQIMFSDYSGIVKNK